jgi:NADH dehydrogenase FAD-containing subunit
MSTRRRPAATPARPRVAVVGANFAGLRVAQSLGGDFEVTVFDPAPWFEWLPNIHEIVSGTRRPADLRLPRRRLIERAGHAFVQEEVTRIEPRQRRLTTASGQQHAFDYCVVAVGGRNETYGVPGADRHALPFRSVADADAIRRRLAALARRKGPQSVVVVGGGFTGIEALGEILRRYRRRRGLSVHLVEAAPTLMHDAAPRIDALVRGHCAAFDVQLHTGSPVAAVTATGVRLTLWTGGVSASPLLHRSGLAPRPRQWAPVDGSLRSRRSRRVFVIGDAAALPRPARKQAFHALEMAECAADNLRRAVAGRPPRTFRPSRTPLLVAFGDLDTFLVAGRSVLASPALAAGKEAVYQVTMAQIDPPLDGSALGQLASRVGGTARRLAPRRR